MKRKNTNEQICKKRKVQTRTLAELPQEVIGLILEYIPNGEILHGKYHQVCKRLRNLLMDVEISKLSSLHGSLDHSFFIFPFYDLCSKMSLDMLKKYQPKVRNLHYEQDVIVYDIMMIVQELKYLESLCQHGDVKAIPRFLEWTGSVTNLQNNLKCVRFQSFIQFDALIQVLSLLPNLEELHVECIDFLSSEEDLLKALQKTKVKILSVDGFEVKNMLSLEKLPYLEELFFTSIKLIRLNNLLPIRLKKLSIADLSWDPDSKNLRIEPIESLERLQVGGEICPIYLCGENVKELSLVTGFCKDNWFRPKYHQLTKLKLQIGLENAKPEFITRMMNACPNIEEVLLEDETDLVDHYYQCLDALLSCAKEKPSLTQLQVPFLHPDLPCIQPYITSLCITDTEDHDVVPAIFLFPNIKKFHCNARKDALFLQSVTEWRDTYFLKFKHDKHYDMLRKFDTKASIMSHPVAKSFPHFC